MKLYFCGREESGVKQVSLGGPVLDNTYWFHWSFRFIYVSDQQNTIQEARQVFINEKVSNQSSILAVLAAEHFAHTYIYDPN